MSRHPATAAWYAPGLVAYALAQANARIQARQKERTQIDQDAMEGPKDD